MYKEKGKTKSSPVMDNLVAQCSKDYELVEVEIERLYNIICTYASENDITYQQAETIVRDKLSKRFSSIR